MLPPFEVFKKGNNTVYFYDFHTIEFAEVDSINQVIYQNNILDSFSIEPQKIIRTLDNGYAIVGALLTNNFTHREALLAKIDSAGNVQFGLKVSNPEELSFLSIAQKADSSFIVTGYYYESGCNPLFLPVIVSFSKSGVVNWQKYIHYPFSDESNSTILLDSSSYYILTNNSSHIGLHIYKFNLADSLLWDKVYKINNTPFSSSGSYSFMGQFKDFLFTKDHQLLISGQMSDYNFTDIDHFLIKLDTTGNVIWSKRYDHSHALETTFKTIVASDSSIYFAGGTESMANTNGLKVITKVSNDGNLIWSKEGQNCFFDSYLFLTEIDSGIIRAYSQCINFGTLEYFIDDYDVNANACWNMQDGGTEHVIVLDTLSGYQWENGPQLPVQACLLNQLYYYPEVYDTICMMMPTSVSDFEQKLQMIFPNPISDEISLVEYQGSSPIHISIFDLHGKEVMRDVSADMKIDVKDLSTGLYVLRITDSQHNSHTVKFVKQTGY